MNRPVPRRTVVLGLAAAATLTACGNDDTTASTPSGTPSAAAPSSSAPSASSSPSASAAATVGKDLKAIKVSGAFGKAPKITVPAPWKIDKTRAETLSEGKGITAREQDALLINYHGVNGRTGQVFDSSFQTGSPAFFPLSQVIPGFRKSLAGRTAGSRVLMAVEGKDGYDEMGGSGDGSIAVGDTLIFVVDVLDVSLPEATGKAVAPKKGLPTVSFPKKTAPAITIPKTDPPKKNTVEVLIKGEGKKVTENDQLAIHYQWVSWKTGKVIENSFTNVEALTLSQVIPGWQKGIKGQTVGSRLLIVSPPADAYPDGNAEPPVDKDDTIVGLIDILFAHTPETGQ